MIQYIKELSVLIFILFCLAACKEISFREPQPRGKKILSKVPKKLQGKYLLTDENGVANDTLFVTPTGYQIGTDPKHDAHLSDTLVLKYFKGYYFLNMKEQPEWYLRVIQKDKTGNLAFMTMGNDNNKFYDYLNRLSKQIKIDSVKSREDMLYQIEPSPKELIMLIKEGFFRKTILRKIN